MSELGIKIVEFNKETDEVISEIHTFDDWGLRWLEPYKIEFPEVDKRIIEVPGSWEPIDVTEEITGHVPFKTRSFELNFEVPDEDYYAYEKVKQQIAAYVHGKMRRIYLDNDPDYFYLARLEIGFEKSQKRSSTITIKGNAHPYKYNRLSSLDEWLWDPFDFETGVIGQSKDLLVSGELIEILPATQIPVSPTFITDSPMTVEYENSVIDLPEGRTYSPYIVLKNHDNTLKFTGNGIVSIEYRGGVL